MIPYTGRLRPITFYCTTAILSWILELANRHVASHADVLWGSSRIPAPGTRDEPLRTSEIPIAAKEKQEKSLSFSLSP